MTLGGLGVLDSPNSSGWPPMVCQGWGPMEQLSKSRTNNFLQAKYPTPQMPMPARPWFFQRVQNQDHSKLHNHAGQTQDLPKIHLSTSNPPLQNNHGSFVILNSKRNQKNTIWREGSSDYLTTCTMSLTFSTRPCRTNPRLAKDSPLNFHSPPPQQPRVLCHLVF